MIFLNRVYERYAPPKEKKSFLLHALDNKRINAIFDKWDTEPMAPWDIQEEIATILNLKSI
jgi:hypothetical protein